MVNMDSEEFIHRYLDLLDHSETALVCLEDQVHLGYIFLYCFCVILMIHSVFGRQENRILPAKTCQSVHLHFMALQPFLYTHPLKGIQLWDARQNVPIADLDTTLQVYASS